MRPELVTVQKIFMGLLCFYLTVSAILPLFGYNITLAAMAFETFNPEPESYYLCVIHSAAFMMLAFFGLNYLRRRRPLSSVAPLLVFNNFLILFGVLYQLISFSNIFNEGKSFCLVFKAIAICIADGKTSLVDCDLFT